MNKPYAWGTLSPQKRMDALLRRLSSIEKRASTIREEVILQCSQMMEELEKTKKAIKDVEEYLSARNPGIVQTESVQSKVSSTQVSLDDIDELLKKLDNILDLSKHESIGRS